MTYITKTPVASSIPYDDTIQTPLSGTDDVQEMLDYLKNRLAISASPSFTFARSGSVSSNSWLLNDSVPSNTSGRNVFMNDAVVTNIFVANEDPTAGIILDLYYHDGDSINLTLLGTVTTLAARSNTFSVTLPVVQNKQLAFRLRNTSATAKNIVVGLLIKGSII